MTAAKVQPISDPRAEAVVPIALRDLRRAPWNARKSYDSIAMDELRASIKAHGIQTPLIVRPALNGLPLCYEIVAGHRRFEAALNGGTPTGEVPCIVRDLGDDEARELGLVDNLQREDVPPMEEAEGLGELMKRPGATIESIAAQMAKTAGYVGRRLKLLDAILPVRGALKVGAIEVAHALELARLSAVQQARFLEELNCGYHAPRKGGSIVEAEIAKSAAKTKWSATPDTATRLKHEIANSQLRILSGAPFPLDSKTLLPMPCTECPKRSNNAGLLFEDLAKDTCTDRACYDRKVQAFVAGELGAARREKRVLLRLSADYTSEKNVLRSYDVEKVNDNACGHADEAIWINGEAAGRKLLVCRGGDCEKHRRESYSSTPAKSSPERKKLLKRVREEKAYRVALFKAIAGAKLLLLRPEMLIALVDYGIDRSDGTLKQKAAELLGWDKKLFSGYGDAADKRLRAHLSGLPAPDAVRAALLFSKSSQLSVHEYAINQKPEGLEALAGMFGVDGKAVRGQLQGAGEKAPAKKSAVKAPAAKDGSKKAVGKKAKKGGRR